MQKSPSKVFVDWLEASGKRQEEPSHLSEINDGRIKWHFWFSEDDFVHFGFVERKESESLQGVIEVDKRYMPFGGFPLGRLGKTQSYLHVVLNSSMTEAAVMTAWSFFQLDEEQADRYDDELGSMMFRVRADGYSVFDLTQPTTDNLIKMEGILL